MPRLLLGPLAALLVALCVPATALAAPSVKKGIWGPVERDGASQFPIYSELGAGVYNATLTWNTVAPTRPANPRDPLDPAYKWPAELDRAVAEADRVGMRVAVLALTAPYWANGGKPYNWAPKRPQDYGDFMAAAAKRYPTVKYWIAWGEPSRHGQFEPIARNTAPGKRLTRAQQAAPRLYARMLDSAYGRIKKESPRSLVVGGNTFTSGDIGPRNWIRYLKLPNGRAPRMDLYGHNPFTSRRPDLKKRPLVSGYADLCDLDDMVKWIDRDLGRRPNRRKIKLWLGEYTTPTDHFSGFSYKVTPAVQASWLRSALRLTRRFSRVETLNWLTLYDQAPRPNGSHTTFGLIRADGSRKPSFNAFKRG